MIPASAVDPRAARAALAVWRGARSIGEVVEATGIDQSSAYGALLRAEFAGLVSWERGKARTLRPTVVPVPFGPASRSGTVGDSGSGCFPGNGDNDEKQRTAI